MIFLIDKIYEPILMYILKNLNLLNGMHQSTNDKFGLKQKKN